MNAVISNVALDALATWQWAVLVYFLVVNSVYLVLLASAVRELCDRSRRVWDETRDRLLGSELAPSISMLVPAYNEAATVAESVRALLTLRYPNLEVVLVNDGSPDETLEVLKREFELTPIHPVYRREVSSHAVRALFRSRVKPELVRTR